MRDTVNRRRWLSADDKTGVLLSTAVRLLLCVVIVGLPVVTSSTVNAELTGDTELLQKAAVKYRSNIERLRTWRGQVKLRRHSIDKDDNVLIECRINFAHDANSGNRRYGITITKDVTIAGEREAPRLPLQSRAGIFRKGAYYRLIYPLAQENALRVAYVQSKKFMDPGYSYGTFEAMYFFTNGGTPFDKYWDMYRKNAKHAELSGTIKLAGSRVILTLNRVRVSAKYSLHTVYEIDLAASGNVTRVETRLLAEGSESVTVCRWNWEDVNGVFVPKTITKDHNFNGSPPYEYHVTLDWEQNVVNEKLPDDAFELLHLGLRRGDWVYDSTTHTRFVIEDPTYPPGPDADSDVQPRETP